MITSNIIGVMSGSSCDGVDVWVTHSQNCSQELQAKTYDYPDALKGKLIGLLKGPFSYNELICVEREYTQFLLAVLKPLVEQFAPISLIGIHGHTVSHDPISDFGSSKQLLQPVILAEELGCMVVADFRQRDIALGGQGAPLAPLYHSYRFKDHASNFAVVNIGGIANISHIKNGNVISGYDLGPGNALMDYWVLKHFDLPYDKDGKLAARGKVISSLLIQLKADDFIKKAAPKSIHRDYFSGDWVHDLLDINYNPYDVLRTLAQFTVDIICESIEHSQQLILVGGGVHNRLIVDLIGKKAKPYIPEDVDFIEAQLVAWLAEMRYQNIKLDYTQVTGAKIPTWYGEIYSPSMDNVDA
tara:strand:- start:12483 stop:13553 length:1071 start_codon:yes stop_codon:yes gene_type:complete